MKQEPTTSLLEQILRLEAELRMAQQEARAGAVKRWLADVRVEGKLEHKSLLHSTSETG